MKIQHKVIYLLVVIFLLYTSLQSGFIYYSISNYSFNDFYKRLEIRAAVAAKIELESAKESHSIKKVDQEYLETLPNQADYFIPVKNRKSVQALPNEIPQTFFNEVIAQGKASYSKNSTFYSGILYTTDHKEQYVVIVSAENYFYTHHIVYLRNLLIGTLLFAILWIAFFSLLISKTLTKPIKNIINEVEKIGTENLHLRLKTPHQNDSLSQLTQTFNGMLTRLETSFETQKNFISNASHELNTPLTSIIGEADFALSKERDAQEYRCALQNILEAAEKLSKKTKALLFLAQTGYNGKSQTMELIRLDQLILDVKENAEKINAEFKIRIDFSLLPENPDLLKIYGNQQLLHLAISNIVINACKYSNNQVVNLALGVSSKNCLVIIRDSGIGIPANEMPYIYDPYFRASNTTGYEGYGIGLPLTRNIVQMHHGKLSLSSEVGKGTTVQIQLPIAPDSF